MKLEDILKSTQQQAQGYGNTLMGGQVGPYEQEQEFTPPKVEGLLTRPIDGIMGGPVGPADNIQQTPEPRMPMNPIQMRDVRQSLGSNFTEQEAMRDMQMRQLRESLGANFTEQEIMRFLQG